MNFHSMQVHLFNFVFKPTNILLQKLKILAQCRSPINFKNDRYVFSIDLERILEYCFSQMIGMMESSWLLRTSSNLVLWQFLIFY
jgi:hypothetical protein